VIRSGNELDRRRVPGGLGLVPNRNGLKKIHICQQAPHLISEPKNFALILPQTTHYPLGRTSIPQHESQPCELGPLSAIPCRRFCGGDRQVHLSSSPRVPNSPSSTMSGATYTDLMPSHRLLPIPPAQKGLADVLEPMVDARCHSGHRGHVDRLLRDHSKQWETAFAPQTMLSLGYKPLP